MLQFAFMIIVFRCHFVSVKIISTTIVRVLSVYCPCVVRVIHFLYVCECWDTLSPPAIGSGIVSFLNLTIMAIIDSLAIGKSYKSAGNLTYKTVRGRCIASQRITQNKSNTLLQAGQRSTFGMAAKVATLMQVYINSCYEKSKFGSARNSFMSINKNYVWQGLYGEVVEGVVSLVDVFVLSFKDEFYESDTLRFSAHGSSSVITNEQYNVRIWSDSQSNDFNVKFTSSLDFVLPTPISPERIEFVVAGLIPLQGQTAKQISFSSKTYNLTSEKLAELLKMGIKVTLTQNDAKEVTAINVIPTEANMFEGFQAYCVAFPRISSKIPKLTSIMELTQQVNP